MFFVLLVLVDYVASPVLFIADGGLWYTPSQASCFDENCYHCKIVCNESLYHSIPHLVGIFREAIYSKDVSFKHLVLMRIAVVVKSYLMRVCIIIFHI